MAVSKRGNSWQAYVCVGLKKVRKSFPNQAEAEVFEKEARDLLQRGQELKNSRQHGMTLDQLVEVVHQARWKGMAYEADAVANAKDVARIIGGAMRVDAITAETLDRLVKALEERELAPATINRKLSALSALLREAEERGILLRRPKVRRRRETNQRVRFLTEHEEGLLLAHLSCLQHFDERDLCEFLLDIGCRVGDALDARWEDVTQEGVHVRDKKTGNHRTVPMTTRVRNMLMNRKAIQTAEGGLLAGPFSSLSYHEFYRVWKRVQADLGLEEDRQWTIHMLRHTFCSRLVQRGANLFQVQQLVGHKTLDMTRRYGHLAAEQLREAIDLLEGPGEKASGRAKPEVVPTQTESVDVNREPGVLGGGHRPERRAKPSPGSGGLRLVRD